MSCHSLDVNGRSTGPARAAEGRPQPGNPLSGVRHGASDAPVQNGRSWYSIASGEHAPVKTLACWAVVKKTLNERVHRCACDCELPRDQNSARVVLPDVWTPKDSPGAGETARPNRECHTLDQFLDCISLKWYSVYISCL